MRVIPKSAARQLNFFKAHLPPWSENFEQIGLSEEEVDDIEAKVEAAQQCYREQQQAFLQARAATQRFHAASQALLTAGSNAILKIRATAASSDNPKVYTLASLRRPKKAAPIAAPGTPTEFSVELLPVGPLRLQWKCKNPPNAEGTMYEIWREVDLGAKQFLGVAGEKKFTDHTIPEGAKMVFYNVTAVRGKKRGQQASHIVKLGVGPGKAQPAMQVPRAA